MICESYAGVVVKSLTVLSTVGLGVETVNSGINEGDTCSNQLYVYLYNIGRNSHTIKVVVS